MNATQQPIGSLSPEQVHEMFVWLDDLRASGAVNMFGASPLLAQAFSIDKTLARQVWAAWAEAFGTQDGRGD